MKRRAQSATAQLKANREEQLYDHKERVSPQRKASSYDRIDKAGAIT